jgi:N-carbamoyl-L-amino-acid hydrolase
VPGRCRFSLDVRATTDAARDACAQDILAGLRTTCERRGVQLRIEEAMRVPAAPSDATWQARWAQAVTSLGLPVMTMPSGAGHDAMKLHELMPQAMLFVRGENGGISHNPLESTSSHDMDLCVSAFQSLLDQLSTEQP